MGIPQIIIPGSADFINFLSPPSVPKNLTKRLIHYHNPQATLVRTNISENRQLGKVLAEKLNRSRGKVTILWPQKGLSTIDLPQKKFYDPKADNALLQSLIRNLRKEIPILVVDTDINSPVFSEQVVKTFQTTMTNFKKSTKAPSPSPENGERRGGRQGE